MAITINRPVETVSDTSMDTTEVNHAVCGYCYPRATSYGKPGKALCGANIILEGKLTPEKCIVCVDMFGRPCTVCGR